MAYEIIQPPFKKNLRDMTKSEVGRYFQWFMNILPDRMMVLASAVHDTAGFESWQMDYTPASLNRLGHWFVTQVETRVRSEDEMTRMKEKQAFPFEVSDEDLTYKTFSLAMDVGMYLGQVFVMNNSSLKWFPDVSSRKFADYGQSLIDGFGSVPFNPVRIVVVLAYGLVGGKVTGDRLRELYDIWEKRIPSGQ